MRYRILEVEYQGTTYFIPQKRNLFFFWEDMTHLTSTFICGDRYGFFSYDTAVGIIKKDQRRLSKPREKVTAAHPYPSLEK